MALVLFRDTRWTGDSAIFATMEVDLTEGSQLVYAIPNTMMELQDFCDHVEISILTRGYEEWQGSSNLLITTGMVGRLTNTSNAGFAYSISSVTDYLASHGVKALPGRPRSTAEIRGLNWIIRPPRPRIRPMQPTHLETRDLLNGGISLRFTNYEPVKKEPERRFNELDEEIGSDEESVTQTVAVLMEGEINGVPRRKVRCGNCMQKGHPSWECLDSLENWGTLGQPSGKYDYMVKYSAPPPTTPIEEIVPTGWDDDDNQDEQIAMMAEDKQEVDSEETDEDDISPWELFQSQHKFWEDPMEEEEVNAITEEQPEEPELEYPSLQKLAKAVKPQKEVAKPKEVTEGKQKQSVFSAISTGSYQPPVDTAMSPPAYPPGGTPTRDFSQYYPPGRKATFKRDDGSEMWTLPSAQQTAGAMFVIPKQLGMFEEVFSRWESITKNLTTRYAFGSAQEKMDFIENLMGEKEKLIWIAWRVAYQREYNQVLAASDGYEGVQNIMSQIRRVFTLQDPATGSTKTQDEAYRDIEQLSCQNVRDVVPFLNDYFRLAAKTGRSYVNQDLSEKLWMKFPGDLGARIKQAYEKEFGQNIGVAPRILFAYRYLETQCKEAAFARSLKDLEFCKEIPIPGYYNSSKKNQGVRNSLRKSKTYKGKPHDTHIRVERTKYLQNKKCKCYVCGEEGHFAKECPNDRKSSRRVSILKSLELPEDYEVVSVDEGEPQDDDIYSISDDENGYQNDVLDESLLVIVEEEGRKRYLLGQDGSYLPKVAVKKRQYKCSHNWLQGANVQLEKPQCTFCKRNIDRAPLYIHCPTCLLVACTMCSLAYTDQTVEIRPQVQAVPRSLSTNLIQGQLDHMTWQEQQIKKLTGEVAYWKDKYLSSISKALEHDFQTLPAWGKESSPMQKQKQEDSYFSAESSTAVPKKTPSFSFPPLDLLNEAAEMNYQFQAQPALRIQEPAEVEPLIQMIPTPGKAKSMMKIEEESSSEEDEQVETVFMHFEKYQEFVEALPEKRKNGLYNLKVTLEIPDEEPLEIKAILDTGATTCCIDEKTIPSKLLEDNTFTVTFSGVNSVSKATKKLRYGRMKIGENTFRIPYTYAFPMTIGQEIQMIIGCNFIRAMQGGLRIEGNNLTFYKFLTTIETSNCAALIEGEREFDYEEYSQIREIIALNVHEPFPGFTQKIQPLIEDLKQQGVVGEDPLQHWKKNQVTCYLDIKNPDLTVEDKPLDGITPQQKEVYQKHIDILLKLKVIRRSTSRHRTNAFIVHSGTTVDPKTGEEKKGKERMVFNYKRLNDMTHKDQYSLPGIQAIIAKVGRARIFSKFDLKSGFHQVAMHPESIPWTAFWVPQGLFEWLVMPFGLKNAPAIFQRKMDNCFRGTEDFIAVYIDDILVFSETEKEHEAHIRHMLDICIKHGLVLSPTKMKIGQRKVEFLGAIIENGQVKLQPNIIKKVCDFKMDLLETKTGLRSWLGLLNYARPYMPNLGKLLGPLYAKVSPTGERRFNREDRKLLSSIIEQIKNLPDLELPPQDSHIIIESDGCMNGWGGICKWKSGESDPRSTERICAFASGTFTPLKSTIDAEIHAVMNSLVKFKLYYLGKSRITVRTDCQAIIAFFNKSSNNKPSRVRWINFIDFITGCGSDVRFEHIEGTSNQLADHLSRLINTLVLYGDHHTKHEELKLLSLAIEEVSDKTTEWSIQQLRETMSLLTSSIRDSSKKSRPGSEPDSHWQNMTDWQPSASGSKKTPKWQQGGPSSPTVRSETPNRRGPQGTPPEIMRMGTHSHKPWRGTTGW
jgi:hypothetical protein